MKSGPIITRRCRARLPEALAVSSAIHFNEVAGEGGRSQDRKGDEQ